MHPTTPAPEDPATPLSDDPTDIDAADAFGHAALSDPARDDGRWADVVGADDFDDFDDIDDIDV